MIGRGEPRPAARPSPLLIGLLLLGSLTWLSPMVSAARRLQRSSPAQHRVGPDEVVLTWHSSGDLCVRGTSVADSRQVAVIGGQTVTVGQQVQLDGRDYRVTGIHSDRVRLSRVAEAAPTGTLR